MNSYREVGIGYDYLLNHYMGYQQVDYYTRRVFQKGLSETEEILINYYFESDDTILDIGTGCGRFAINAYANGFDDMYGIDLNPKFIERAIEIAKNKRYNIKFSIQNAGKMDFENRKFDSAIFTSDGFSQIPGNENKLAVLKEIHRIMKPNGVFILAVIDENLIRANMPNYANLIDDFRKKKLWIKSNFYDINDVYIYDGGYMHFACIDETTSLIAKSGFHFLYSATAKDILGYNDKKASNISRYFILRK